MSGNSGLSRNCHVIPEATTSGNAALRHHQTMFPYLNIVANLCHIIDLRSFSHHRAAKSSPIDAAIGTDLNIVLDFNDSYLRCLLVPAINKIKSVTVRTNHATRLKNDPVADQTGFPYNASRMQKAILPEGNIPTDQTACSNDASSTNFCTRLDHHSGTDLHLSRINLNIVRNVGPWRNPGLNLR